MLLQQDEEFCQDRDALEMEVREPEARVELVRCFPCKPCSNIEHRAAIFPNPL